MSHEALAIRFFGVGDGDCILLCLPDGRFGLIDSCTRAGRTQAAALDFVRNGELVFCCLTHPHYDHLAGMLDLLRSHEVRVHALWHPLSDLEQMLPFLWKTVRKRGDNRMSLLERERETESVAQLLEWVDRQPVGFSVPVRNTERLLFCEDDLEIRVFASDAVTYGRYLRMLRGSIIKARKVKRKHANRISLALWIRYASHRVWLLGDLPRAQLRALSRRLKVDFHPRSDIDGKAEVVKLPHHGSEDGHFREMNTVFARCDSGDVIVISARGSGGHPSQDVVGYWRNAGKRVVGTWTEARKPSPRLPRFVADALKTETQPAEYSPRDVLLTLPKAGSIDLAYFPAS